MFKQSFLQRIPYIYNFLRINDGYIHEDIKDEDYVLGASPLIKKIVRPDGDWTAFLPETETQHTKNFNYDSMACVSFSFLNILEMLAKAKFNETWNLSDRFLAKMAGTTRSGNSMAKVADTARNSGLVQEKDYPWDRDFETWDSFYKEVNNTLKEVAKEFLQKYTIGYEAVPNNTQAIQEALKYSPLWIGVYAWYQRNGVYYSTGNPNHASTLVKQSIPEKQKLAFDTYSPFLKTLDWNFAFGAIKLVTLNKTGKVFDDNEIKKLVSKGVKYLFRPESHGEIYKLENNALVKVEPQEWLNLNIKEKADKKELLPVNEAIFNKIIL